MPLVTDFTVHKTFNLHCSVEPLHLVFWNSWMNLCPAEKKKTFTGAEPGGDLDPSRCNIWQLLNVLECARAQWRMTAETVNNNVWDWKACLLGVVSWCRHISPGQWQAYSLQDVNDSSSWGRTSGCAPSPWLQLPSGELQVGKAVIFCCQIKVVE